MTDTQQLTLADAVEANSLGPFGADPQGTGRLAALAAFGRTGSQKAAVLLAHLAHPDGLTDYEAHLIAKTSYPHVASTRRKSLTDLQLVEPTELRRPTWTGCFAAVHRLTPLGRDVAAEVARRRDRDDA